MLLGHMLFNCQPNLLFVVELTSWASSAENSNIKENQISAFNLIFFAL
jgi:hypothetical protein